MLYRRIINSSPGKMILWVFSIHDLESISGKREMSTMFVNSLESSSESSGEIFAAANSSVRSWRGSKRDFCSYLCTSASAVRTLGEILTQLLLVLKVAVATTWLATGIWKFVRSRALFRRWMNAKEEDSHTTLDFEMEDSVREKDDIFQNSHLIKNTPPPNFDRY